MQRIQRISACCILSLIYIVSFAQVRTVRGKVLDSGGQSLAGITVLAGSSNGVMTDGNGEFSLDVPDGISELEFICLGYCQSEGG